MRYYLRHINLHCPYGYQGAIIKEVPRMHKMLHYMIDNSLEWVYKASDLTVSAQLQRRQSTTDQRWVFSLFSSLLVSNTKTLQ